MNCFNGCLGVDPRISRQVKLVAAVGRRQRVPAESGASQNCPQLAHQRAQGCIESARSVLRPQQVDQLVPCGLATAVADQVSKGQPPLATWEPFSSNQGGWPLLTWSATAVAKPHGTSW